MRGTIASLLAAAVALAFGVRHARRAGARLRSPDSSNGRIIDGTGSPWYRGDIAVRQDTIVRIAPRIDAAAGRVIDAGGKVVAPGFIDIHTHARRGIFEVPTADNYVRQGVTTLMEGPDGSSPLPIKPFLDRVAADARDAELRAVRRPGHVRDAVIGPVNRKATDAEIEKMRGLVRQGMEDGAFGLSSGLFYVPGTFTPTAEVIELAKVAGRMGGIYISHMRDEASSIARQRERDDRDRRERRAADAGDASQDHRQGELGQERRHAEADRRGARARRRRDHRSISLHRIVDQHPGRADAGVGARRRAGGGAEAAADAVDAQRAAARKPRA